jgi:hypothetical protein
VSHSRGNRADETLSVNKESTTVRTETALAVDSTEGQALIAVRREDNLSTLTKRVF